MNPVVVLYVAKGESQVQANLEKKKPYKKSFKVKHVLEGLASLFDFIKEIEDISGERPPLVMESTGHYHTPVIQYFEDNGYLIIIVSPLNSYKAKSSSMRKVKTDIIDANHLCELYYKEDLEPYKKCGIQLMNLRILRDSTIILHPVCQWEQRQALPHFYLNDTCHAYDMTFMPTLNSNMPL
jgi:transposase